MIEGFEQYTHELSKRERVLALEIAHDLKDRIGPKMAITSNRIIEKYKDKDPALCGARVRKIINFICKKYLPNLLGDSYGYYISYDKTELMAGVSRLMKRANENIRRAEILAEYVKGIDINEKSSTFNPNP